MRRAQVNGALLSLGDCHTAQGDSEFDGTAIETSITATLRLTLHRAADMKKARRAPCETLHREELDYERPLVGRSRAQTMHRFCNDVPVDHPLLWDCFSAG